MNGRRAVIGLTVLCALMLSAALASGASGAVTLGTTAFTCKEGTAGSEVFEDAHCLTAGGTKKFRHVGFTGTTSIKGTNGKTAEKTEASAPSVLEGTLSGLVTAVTCTTVSGTGTMENMLEVREPKEKEVENEHTANGSGVITYKGCTVTKPAGRGCKVVGGEVITENLTATTKLAGDFVEFIGVGAEKKFASITLENCEANKPPNTTYPVNGSVKIPPSGATLSSTIAATKAQGTLIFGGNPSGLQGSLTITNATSGTPLTVTTPSGGVYVE